MVDIDALREQYFTFDAPVPFKTKHGDTVYIKPVSMKDQYVFVTSADIIAVDKNSIPSADIISMSYLQFAFMRAVANETDLHKLVNVLLLCLGLEAPAVRQNEIKRYELIDRKQNIVITANEFDDIRKIIMYQNFPHYDDQYVAPELKAAMEETDALKNRNVSPPSLERKMGIITAHCGMSKIEQSKMTMRAFSLLFEEVCGEVEFTTTRPIAMLSKESAQKIDHWIYPKKKGKFDGYITERDAYTQSMGGADKIRSAVPASENSRGASLDNAFSNFSK